MLGSASRQLLRCTTKCAETDVTSPIWKCSWKNIPWSQRTLTTVCITTIPVLYCNIIYNNGFELPDVDTRGLFLLSRKTVAEAFWNREVEDELRRREWMDKLFTHARSREEIMMMIDRERASTVYPHEQCSDECKKRGKSKLYTQCKQLKYACIHACMFCIQYYIVLV